MAVEIRVPQLGESVVEATVLRWLKKEGDTVGEDDVLAELETDKVNVEIPAGTSGILEAIVKHEGDTVGVNEVLATVSSGAANGTASGTGVGAVNGTAAAASAAPTSVAETPAITLPPAVAGGDAKRVTPVAEKMAADKGLDLAQITGSGANHKITKDDVTNHAAQSTAAPTPVASVVETAPAAPKTPPVVQTAATSAPPTPVKTGDAGSGPSLAALLGGSDRREEREPMSRLRQTIASRLLDVSQNTAMLTTFNEVDMTAIMAVRARRKDKFKEKYGVNLGFMSFFTKATVGALKAFPYLNAEIDDKTKEIVKKHYYDMGIAVGTERGLVVPVVRNADRKTFAEIEKDISALALKARDNKLTIPDMTGGTFTITNGGVYGSLMSTPILNAPQVGILGMHKIQERAIVEAGQVVVRPMMYLALSYDHRIVDGSDAVRFLVRIKDLLEDPESLLIEG